MPAAGTRLRRKNDSQSLEGRQRQGALLDATGHSLTQISALVGVHESTVSRWRRLPAYRDEIERLEKLHVEAVAPLLEQIKSSVAEGASKAVRTFEKALEAVDEDGNPLWRTRLEAAENLKAWKEKEYSSPATGGNGSPQQTMNIILNAADVDGKIAVRPPQQIEQPAPALEPGDDDD